MCDPEIGFQAAKVSQVVNLSCGCMGTFHHKGDLKGSGWVVIPCSDHANDRDGVKRMVAKRWEENISLASGLSLSSRA